MNSIKPLLVACILGAIGYVAYISINQGPLPEPPPEIDRDWAAAPPEIEMGELGQAAPTEVPSMPSTMPGTSAGGKAPAFAGPAAPSFPPAADLPAAPAFTGAATAGSAPAAGSAAAPAAATTSAAPSWPPAGSTGTSAGTPAESAAASPQSTVSARLSDTTANDAEASPPESAPAGPESAPAVADGAASATAEQSPDTAPPAGSAAAPPWAGNAGAEAQSTGAAQPWNVPATGAAAGSEVTQATAIQPEKTADAAPPWSQFGSGSGATSAAGATEGSAAGENSATEAGTSGPSTFAATMATAQQQLQAGKLAEAHLTLSAIYGDQRIVGAERQQLTDLLDQLAGTVVYSREHLLEQAYTVQPGERLQDIAARHDVSWQLLAKINGVLDPAALAPGEQLKVIRGPFTAVVDVQRQELTLMLEDQYAGTSRYAGRFPILVQDGVAEGNLDVQQKSLEAQSLALTGGVTIGGQPTVATATAPSIQLSGRDAGDVYDILAQGSKVVIRK